MFNLKGSEALQRRTASAEPKPIRLVGPHSPASLGLLISEVSKSKGLHLLVFSTETQVEEFYRSLEFFMPNIQAAHLNSFDVSPYSGLYPKRTAVASRLRWLNDASNSTEGKIFTATVRGLAQNTLNYDFFVNSTYEFKVGDSLPGDINELLDSLGYHSVQTVEDIGHYSQRGAIFDLLTPAHQNPIRLELFGDQIESIREFDIDSQRSLYSRDSFTLIPSREALYRDEHLLETSAKFSASLEGRDYDAEEAREIQRSIGIKRPFFGMDFCLPFFFESLSSPLEFFNMEPTIWLYEEHEICRELDEYLRQLKIDFDQASPSPIHPDYQKLYRSFDQFKWPNKDKTISVESISIEKMGQSSLDTLEFKTFNLSEFHQNSNNLISKPLEHTQYITRKLQDWKDDGYSIFVSTQTRSSTQRMRALLESCGFIPTVRGEDAFTWHQFIEEQVSNPKQIDLIPRTIGGSLRAPGESVIILRDEDFWGRTSLAKKKRASQVFLEKSQALSFGDLKPGDLVVHRLHGIGVYEGLELMNIQGVDSEFIQLRYKNKDKLFLPVYRVGQIQKYSGPSSESLIDKLGGSSWGKTTGKVRKHVRDLADKLLKLYAKRSEAIKDPFPGKDPEYQQFEDSFPYQETEDQLTAIQDVISDMESERPMDRLICGDVGFGKTEVAMRAAFKAVQANRQVALIAPTTLLTFQHTETFKNRMNQWPVVIRTLNRFISAKEIKQTLADMKEGKVDIVIGTHRLLSKDVHFKNLGLLVIDEEQKFGVAHKERIRQLKESVDTLTLSATPIPRTLNMSLMGLRDLSLINTPPRDRLPTRTFVCKFDEATIRKAALSEIARGGQIFFLHNRVNSIYELTDRLRSLLPEVRISLAHGQMPEDQLEKTAIKFFKHEVDMLVCTSIIESGMDIPRANTIFIDNAHQLGVSQLYQLRGRVGRSKERAYCYLILPKHKKIDKEAQERIRIIQENSGLGSGIKVAHYDLELRGAGDLLGAEQSGHINAVGYEMYLELVEDAVRDLKGLPHKDDEIEPEINLRVPAFIPDKYIPDVRVRLSYYKVLSNITEALQLDDIETDLKDQFGTPPDEVMNLMGLMLIRKQCKDLGVKDASSGLSWLTLSFTDQTPLPTNEVIRLASMDNKKYNLTPDQKLKIRMKEISWPRVHEELSFLLSLCPKH